MLNQLNSWSYVPQWRKTKVIKKKNYYYYFAWIESIFNLMYVCKQWTSACHIIMNNEGKCGCHVEISEEHWRKPRFRIITTTCMFVWSGCLCSLNLFRVFLNACTNTHTCRFKLCIFFLHHPHEPYNTPYTIHHKP